MTNRKRWIDALGPPTYPKKIWPNVEEIAVLEVTEKPKCHKWNDQIRCRITEKNGSTFYPSQKGWVQIKGTPPYICEISTVTLKEEITKDKVKTLRYTKMLGYTIDCKSKVK